jgi:hypothetical protein
MTTRALLKRLKAVAQLAQQTEQAIISNIEVQRTHPERLENAEKLIRLAQDEIRLVREEDTVGIAHWDEIADVFPLIIDRVNNQMTIDQNRNFITATNKESFTDFIANVLKYGKPVFQDVLESLPDVDFAEIEDIIDFARRNRFE